MGALTLKSFPFELRGWDIEKFESIDPTDGFGSNTRVYVNRNSIVLIEPDYDSQSFNTWLTDKGRQFFDSTFSSVSEVKSDNKYWAQVVKSINKTLYLLDHCNAQHINNLHFFTIIFENLSLETLSMLSVLTQKYSFVKVRRAEGFTLNNNLESFFKINLATNKIKLYSSTLCLLIANNPRYEGYYLNLNLRQRFLKGNFKCLALGSLIDLTFPVSFLGSKDSDLKTIVEGNNIKCQDLKFSKNPLLIVNNELMKKNDSQNIIDMIKVLQYSGIFSQTWNGFNMLNPSLTETGNHSTNIFKQLDVKDLFNFSFLYFLNISLKNLSSIKVLIDAKLLNYSSVKSQKQFKVSKTINQTNNHNDQFSGLTDNFINISSSMFYENDETFINTEGFIKRTNKLIFKQENKSNWLILRRILKKSNKQLKLTQNKPTLSFNANNFLEFKNFIYFQYYATQTLTNVNFYLSLKTQSFTIYKNSSFFRLESKKNRNSKFKYWLDDFFCGGLDEYSEHSLVLVNCSNILRSETTNFF